ncbi:hypothetical protein B0T25DRAFT_520896 [Lasiosphaeria hispida]|uniref:Nephrocystin 3-like N-terminal domain-containing protein n=1 Tax=Lasiosphaeria hispida TaxID=260671 RepID=A0AAJ0HBD9_9PEZI|nr:hypothetical protein B0T25DRAFT_520896 [Lasiosphaeria hispida]
MLLRSGHLLLTGRHPKQVALGVRAAAGRRVVVDFRKELTHQALHLRVRDRDVGQGGRGGWGRGASGPGRVDKVFTRDVVVGMAGGVAVTVSVSTVSVTVSVVRVVNAVRAVNAVSGREAKEIHNYLYMPELGSRVSQIEDPFQNTFRWVFDVRPFSNWLQGGESSLFWIHGKPGSGNSTLMKFVSESRQTRNLFHR